MKLPVLLFLIFLVISSVIGAEDREIYLVLMEGEAVAFRGGSIELEEGRRRHDIHSEASKAHAKSLVESHDQLLESKLEKGSYQKIYSFNHLVNGFAVHTTPSQIRKIKDAPGVRLVEKDRGVKQMTTYTPQFLGLPQNVWTHESGGKISNAGEGIVIGFVDTGINPTHPSFSYDPLNDPSQRSENISRFSGACESGPHFPASSCNGKIVSARFFSAGAQAAANLNSSYDILSPYDPIGHGSHVASTAAGNSGVPVVVNSFFYGRASGIAPRARIAVYKALYPTISTSADTVAAIDQAAKDGVDILTLSISPDVPEQDTLTFLNTFDLFLLFARRAGVLVVQAAGNSGPAPLSVVSYSPWALGVASCNTDRTYPGTLVLGNGTKIGGVGLSGPSSGNGSIKYKLVLARDAVKANGTFPRTSPYIEECQYPEALDPVKVQGSVVICNFLDGFYNGTSSLPAIVDTAKALGFMGFIFVANPAYGDILAEPLPFHIPGIIIPRTRDAKIISEYYEEHTCRDENGVVRSFDGRASISEGRVASYMEVTRTPVVTRFSSRGPDFVDYKRNATDVLKPDILAPGHQIWAAWSPMSVETPFLAGYNFAVASGTSMAAPHIAGIAALIMQQNPSWTPSMIASAMSTTAINYDNTGDPIMAEGYDLYSLNPSTPFDHGAGLVNPARAMNPGLVFPSGYRDYIGFLCSLPAADPDTIETATGESCTYTIGVPSNLNLPSVTVSALTGFQSIRRSVKNVASNPETYFSSVLMPKGVAVEIKPTWFQVDPQCSQDLEIQLSVTQPLKEFSFGEIVFTGSLNHIVRIPLSVLPVST